MGKRAVYTSGERRGKLAFVEEVPGVQYANGVARRARFRCDCGNEIDAFINSWKKGATKSCGCLQREYRFGGKKRDTGHGHPTHGRSGEPIYKSWVAMKARSTPGGYKQIECPSYVGVGRDPRWDDFEAFFADMGGSYFEGAHLARYGDVGDYTATNCRWVTPSENARESLERGDRMHRMTDGRFGWDVARANGIKKSTFQRRIELGWTVDVAATKPPRPRT